MKICFIAPGEIEIPPNGWGALETVLWNQYSALKKLGHDVYFINERDTSLTYKKILNITPDIVHLHYGKHWEIMPKINCKKIITSHDGSFPHSSKFHEQLVRKFYYDCYFFVLTTWEKDFLIKIGISKNKIKILPNGVDIGSFAVSFNPKKTHKTLCLGKIDSRKNQSFLQSLNCNIDFVGQNCCKNFNALSKNFLGPWTREQVYSSTTEYSNLVLVSNSELQPLVCLEALAAGLGLVISESAAQNLDTDMPFITVIPQNKIHDAHFIKKSIEENRKTCNKIDRQIIIDYAQRFSWLNIGKKYISFL